MYITLEISHGSSLAIVVSIALIKKIYLCCAKKIPNIVFLY